MAQLFTLRELPKYDLLAAVADPFPQISAEMLESWVVLLKTSSDLVQALEAHLSQFELSPGRFTVLMIIFHEENLELTPSELADRIGCTRATMTGLLDGLEHSGLVLREPQQDDRRTMVIRLTPQGRTTVQALLPNHFNQVAALMNCLDERERKTLSKLLNKIREGLPEICAAACDAKK